MSVLKKYREENVYNAALRRVQYAFENFERVYVSFSGGKDSTVMLHLACLEARKRGVKIGVLVIDLEAQYSATIEHVGEMLDLYADTIDPHWVCLPMLLRNAVTQFEPRWCCWDPDAKDIWVRQMPERKEVVSDCPAYPFFQPKMEFEEFMVLWGEWYSQGKPTCGMIGIRADESLNRFRTVASRKKEMHGTAMFTTKVSESLYNLYPIYDWRTEDVWRFHAMTGLCGNHVYDLMHKAGLGIHQMRLCQPYGDDQKKGLWLYHLLEPQTWFRVVARVNGANSGSLYVSESGNITGARRIDKPTGHTWKSFCNLLLESLPKKTREHYISKFKSFIKGWKGRGYHDGIPDEAPAILETKHWAPSYRRMCRVLLRNDYWCKGLGLTQPKSEAYQKYMQIKKDKK